MEMAHTIAIATKTANHCVHPTRAGSTFETTSAVIKISHGSHCHVLFTVHGIHGNKIHATKNATANAKAPA